MDDTGTPTLSVSELNRQARMLLERGFGDCWVEGEVSSVARPASGHVYFTLKDDRAQLKCALFRNRARFTAPLNNGDQVRLRGKVSIFEPRGDYQMIVEAVQPAGQGALLAAFERLKRQLDAQGVFANQRPLPYPPRHLAVISSASGAAIRDVLAVLAARWPLVPVHAAAGTGAGQGGGAGDHPRHCHRQPAGRSARWTRLRCAAGDPRRRQP